MLHAKSVDEVKTLFMSNRVFLSKMRLCTAGQSTDDNMIRRMRLACWIPRATDTHSEYVTAIAFPQQQRLRERASILRHTYIACVVLEIQEILPRFVKPAAKLS